MPRLFMPWAWLSASARAGAEANARYLAHQQRASDVSGGFGAISKVLRMLLQSAVLGARCLSGHRRPSHRRHHDRLLDPDVAGAGACRAGDRQLEGLRQCASGLEASQDRSGFAVRADRAVEAAGSLHAPVRRKCRHGRTGRSKICRSGHVFRAPAGSGLGVIGPSASGKSSLARMLVGVWPSWRGKIRLDGAAIEQWLTEDLGRHVGYLPQDVELFAGTVTRTSRASRRTRIPRLFLPRPRRPTSTT